MKRRKKFVGWAIIASRNGSNWTMQHDREEWPIISEIVKTKKELDDPTYLVEGMRLRHSCMPKQIRKIYK